MGRKKRPIRQLALLLLLWASLLATGCSLFHGVPQWSGSGFIKKEFLEYRRIAVLPFEGDPAGEVSDAFGQSLHERFPQIGILERRDLLKVFKEEDLAPSQADEIRIKIERAMGAQALVVGSVYYPSVLRWFLQIKIVDAKTGEVTGRSLVEIDFIGAERAKEACDLAVQMLKVR